MEIQVVDKFNLIEDPAFATMICIRRWNSIYAAVVGNDIQVYVTYVPSKGYLVSPHVGNKPTPMHVSYWFWFKSCPANVREVVSPLIWTHKMRMRGDIDVEGADRGLL